MKIKDTVAIVTGASSGIGAATARVLAERGATVIAVARRAERLEEVVARCREHTPLSRAYPVDLMDLEACRGLIRDVQAEFGHIDILVNNAGIPMRRHGGSLTMEDVQGPLQLNYVAAVQLTLAALPAMLDRASGSIINVTSVAGYVPVPREASYSATKAALSAFSHGLAVDLDGTGIHVGVVAPGPIATEIWEIDGSEAAQYQGKLFPPEVVARDIVRSIERRRVHVTSPRRYGLTRVLYVLMGGAVRAGLRRYARKPVAARSAD